jgi:hypothetical protein
MDMITGCEAKESSMNTPLSMDELASTLQPQENVAARTTCCIVGGGGGGMMLALLLPQQAVSVTLLEAHKNFDADFRDAFAKCTMQPASTDGIAGHLSSRTTLSTFRRFR